MAEPEKWAVVSCDQFTSQRDYWQTLEAFVGDSPSTLKLIFPEVYLEDDGEEERTNKINATMKEYLDSSLMCVTCLSPIIGYEKAAKTAQTAHADGSTLKEACLKLGYMTEAEFDKNYKPEKMI